MRLPSVLLHAATGFLVFLIGRKLYSDKCGLIAAVAYATLPGVSLSAGIISTDVPLLFAWALALLAFVHLVSAPTLDDGWPAGLRPRSRPQRQIRHGLLRRVRGDLFRRRARAAGGVEAAPPLDRARAGPSSHRAERRLERAQQLRDLQPHGRQRQVVRLTGASGQSARVSGDAVRRHGPDPVRRLARHRVASAQIVLGAARERPPAARILRACDRAHHHASFPVARACQLGCHAPMSRPSFW